MSLRVLLTDAHELAGLGALRSLGRAGHRVTAAFPRDLPAPAATRSRHCHAAVQAPDPWREHPSFQRWLRRAALEHDVVLPLSEAAMVAAAAVRRELGSARPLWLLPSDEVLKFALSKYHATRAAQRLGLRTPRTVFISDAAGGKTADDAGVQELGYPLIIKADNHLGPGGVYHKGSSVRVSHPDEAAAMVAELLDSGAAVIAQELVPGYGVGAFFLRHEGQVRLRFAHRRLHEVPWTGGFSSLRESTDDPALLALGERLLDGLGYDGVAMVEFRRSAPEAEPWFLEINGRLWGSLALALHAGVDFPLAWLEARLGRPAAPAPRYRAGIRCRNVFPGEILYLKSVLQARPAPEEPSPGPPGPEGPAAPPRIPALLEFLRLSLDPTIRHDHFWWSDPLPGLAQALGGTCGLAVKATRHVLRRAESLRWAPEVAALVSGAAARLGRLRPEGSVLFVCYGNICRSPFAAAYWNRRLRELGRRGPIARSAGLYPVPGRPVPPRFRELGRAFGVDLSEHRSAVLDEETLRGVDAVFLMDRQNLRALRTAPPAALPRLFLLGSFGPASAPEIGDPFGLSPAQARRCYQQIVAALEGLLRHTAS